jgi:transposase
MSEPKSSRPRAKRSFTEEFKQDAVRLVTIQKYSFAATAKALGISEQSLRRWHSLLSPKPEPCGENATVDEHRAENERLKRQLQRVELEREILKKAAAYFAMESL